MLYHRTRDSYYVKDFLRHKSLSSTEIYINIERTPFEDQSDEFTVKVAEKPEDIRALLEPGLENVCQKDNSAYLKKGNSLTHSSRKWPESLKKRPG
jgi:hypothetical protein